MNIQVEVKNVYGNTTIYPVCDKAKMFASIAGTKTLTREALEKVKKLGYEIINATKYELTTQGNKMKQAIWKTEEDLMKRLEAAQNKPINQNIDILTFAGFCDTREELEQHVFRYELDK